MSDTQTQLDQVREAINQVVDQATEIGVYVDSEELSARLSLLIGIEKRLEQQKSTNTLMSGLQTFGIDNTWKVISAKVYTESFGHPLKATVILKSPYPAGRKPR